MYTDSHYNSVKSVIQQEQEKNDVIVLFSEPQFAQTKSFRKECDPNGPNNGSFKNYPKALLHEMKSFKIHYEGRIPFYYMDEHFILLINVRKRDIWPKLLVTSFIKINL